MAAGSKQPLRAHCPCASSAAQSCPLPAAGRSLTADTPWCRTAGFTPWAPTSAVALRYWHTALTQPLSPSNQPGPRAGSGVGVTLIYDRKSKGTLNWRHSAIIFHGSPLLLQKGRKAAGLCVATAELSLKGTASQHHLLGDHKDGSQPHPYSWAMLHCSGLELEHRRQGRKPGSTCKFIYIFLYVYIGFGSPLDGEVHKCWSKATLCSDQRLGSNCSSQTAPSQCRGWPALTYSPDVQTALQEHWKSLKRLFPMHRFASRCMELHTQAREKLLLECNRCATKQDSDLPHVWTLLYQWAKNCRCKETIEMTTMKMRKFLGSDRGLLQNLSCWELGGIYQCPRMHLSLHISKPWKHMGWVVKLWNMKARLKSECIVSQWFHWICVLGKNQQ